MEVIFEWNGWAIAALVAAGIFVIVMITASVVLSSEFGDTTSHQFRWKLVGMWVVSLLVSYAIGNLAVVIASTSGQAYVSTADAAKSFGLEVGQEYPFEVGSVFVGTTGNANGGFLGFDGQVRSESMMKVGFTSSTGDSYLLEIPTSVMTFKQVDNVRPSMVLNLKFENLGQAPYNAYGPCHWTLNSLWFVCEKEPVSSIAMIPDDIGDGGLAPLVTKYISGATITLTPEMYQTLLNG